MKFSVAIASAVRPNTEFLNSTVDSARALQGSVCNPASSSGVVESGAPHTEYTRIPLVATECGNTPEIPSFEPVIVFGAPGNAVASVTVASRFAVASAWLVANTDTAGGAGVAIGAVYVPVASMEPTVAGSIDQATDVSDAGLEHIGAATSLKILLLYKTKVTDEGLAHLAGLQNLELLELKGTAVTDAGLEHLSKLSGLKQLYVGDTAVTLDAARKLRESLPGCKIHL